MLMTSGDHEGYRMWNIVGLDTGLVSEQRLFICRITTLHCLRTPAELLFVQEPSHVNYAGRSIGANAL